MTTKLVRIRPSNKREKHTVAVNGSNYSFTKGKWFEVPARVAAVLAEEKMSDLSEDAPYVFEVRDHASAKAVDEAEAPKARGPLPGSLDNPVLVEAKAADPDAPKKLKK